MSIFDILKKKKEKELFPSGIPESEEKEEQQTIKPEGFVTATEERLLRETPITEPQTDRTELILAKLETIKAMLDNIDQRLRKIEKIAEESQETYWK